MATPIYNLPYPTDYDEDADVPQWLKDLADATEAGIQEAVGDIDLSTCEKVINKTTTINSSSTNTQYPTALAVYTYVNTIVGDIDTALDLINGEVIS